MTKSNRKDIMVDIETLGTKQGSTIFQIDPIEFDITTGVKGKYFNLTSDISLDKEVHVEGSTIKWWLDKDKDLFQKLLSSGKCSSYALLEKFHSWITHLIEESDHKEVYLWGNGILFDNNIIRHQFEKNGLDYPIFFRNDRDVRTILELASHKLNLSQKEIINRIEFSDLQKHNAINDAYFQVNLVMFCYNSLVNK